MIIYLFIFVEMGVLFDTFSLLKFCISNQQRGKNMLKAIAALGADDYTSHLCVFSTTLSN
jgi:hypothetical protein